MKFVLKVREPKLIDVEHLDIGEAFVMQHEDEKLICTVEKRREVDILAYVEGFYARWHFDFGEMFMPLNRIYEVKDV